MLAVLHRVRDRLLITVLTESGRIGEAVGLRREDMHLLASNTVLDFPYARDGHRGG